MDTDEEERIVTANRCVKGEKITDICKTSIDQRVGFPNGLIDAKLAKKISTSPNQKHLKSLGKIIGVDSASAL